MESQRNFQRSFNGYSDPRRNGGGAKKKFNRSDGNKEHKGFNQKFGGDNRFQGDGEKKRANGGFQTKKRTPRSLSGNFSNKKASDVELGRVQPNKSPSRIDSRYTPDVVKMIGPLFASPEELGFQRKKGKTHRGTPRYLIALSRLLVTPPFVQNEWDKNNQNTMMKMEEQNQSGDYQGLYEEFQRMREVERKHMEDSGLVDAENISKNLDEAIRFQGSCLDMCPVFERVRRALENNVKSFERDPHTNRISRFKAVKAFSRPAAGQPPPLPSDVRPPHILKSTLDYLVDNIVPHLPESHSFIWDRTRSIRQDFTYQNSFGPEAIECNERIVRIHLYSLHVMAGSEVEYSQQQELEQLNKALQTLMEIYQDVRDHGGSAPNEAEFQAYNLLSHLRDSELEREIQNLPNELFDDDLVQLALMFRNISSQNNIVERGYNNILGALNLFLEFFRRVFDENTPYLIACLLETHFNDIRFYALKSMSRCYHSKGKAYSAIALTEALGFDSQDDLIKFVEYYDIDVIYENNEALVDLFNREKLETKYKLNSPSEKSKLSQAFSKKINNKIKNIEVSSIINSGKPVTSLNLQNTNERRILQDTTDNRSLKGEIINKIETDGQQKVSHSLSLSDFLKRAPTPQVSNFNLPLQPNNDSTYPTSKNQIPAFNKVMNENVQKSHLNREVNEYENQNQNQNQTKSFAPAAQHFGGELQSFSATRIPISSVASSDPNTSMAVPTESSQTGFQFTKKPISFQSIPGQNEQEKMESFVKKPKLTELPGFADALSSFCSLIVRTTVEEELQKVLPKLYAAFTRDVERRQVIKYLSKNLFNAFLSEVLYEKLLEVRATHFHARHLELKFFKVLAARALALSKRREQKRKKLDELENFSFVGKTLSRSDGSASDEDNLRKLFIRSRCENLGYINEKLQAIRNLWEPLDISGFLKICIDNNRAKLELDTVSLRFLIVVENWNSAYSKWLNTKLELKINKEKQIYERVEKKQRLEIEFTSLPKNNYLNHQFFSTSSFILFECGFINNDQVSKYVNLESKLKRDAGVLRKIADLIQKYSYYKALLIILFWDIAETGANKSHICQLLELEQIKSKGNILDLVFCDMTDKSVNSSDMLEQGFENLSLNYRIELTSRGIRHIVKEKKIKRSLGPPDDTLPDLSKIQNSSKMALDILKAKRLKRSQLDKKYAYLYRHLSGYSRHAPNSNTSVLDSSLNRSSNSISFYPDSTFLLHNSMLANSSWNPSLANASIITGFGNGVIEESTPFSSPKRPKFAKPKSGVLSSLQQLCELTAEIKAKYAHGQTDNNTTLNHTLSKP